ncbi:MAG TPA: fructose-6-phosphate aldolase [bacterium]|nr:fructose-6-phosphate aldolase [bacterium]
MKFFIDTANVEEIREAEELGILDGVTTNPTLLAREIKRTGSKPETILKNICDIVKGPVSAEVTGMEQAGMVGEARKLSSLDPHIVVKVPVTLEGLKTVRQLSLEGIKTNVTLIFSPCQALLAAKAGASFVSPFVGRLDDISHDGMELVDQIVVIYENHAIETEIIAASVRHPLHVIQAAMIGADIATIPFKVIHQLVRHPLTDLGIERFLSDWNAVQTN